MSTKSVTVSELSVRGCGFARSPSKYGCDRLPKKAVVVKPGAVHVDTGGIVTVSVTRRDGRL